MDECIRTEYDEAANCLGRDDGKWVGAAYWNTYELLTDEIELDLPKDNKDELFEAILSGLDNTDWCHRDPYGLTESEITRFSWDHFCRICKHKRHFFFLDQADPSDSEILSPEEVLKRITDYAEEVRLFKTLAPGFKIFRARYQRPGEPLRTSRQLGPPIQSEAVRPNRMSPAGIVMFYSSDSPNTALRETSKAPGTFVVGEWCLTRETTVLDLNSLPPIPSLFQEVSDAMEYDPRRLLMFLHHISREISKPIERDAQTHIEYVPTQVVTEYVRSYLPFDGKGVDGIRYPSSVHPGHASFVFFATQDNILPVPNEEPRFTKVRQRWIELVGRRSYSVRPDQVASWNENPMQKTRRLIAKINTKSRGSWTRV
jgi:hypothetical protein